MRLNNSEAVHDINATYSLLNELVLNWAESFGDSEELLVIIMLLKSHPPRTQEVGVSLRLMGKVAAAIALYALSQNTNSQELAHKQLRQLDEAVNSLVTLHTTNLLEKK
jgi:site-specific recombinase